MQPFQKGPQGKGGHFPIYQNIELLIASKAFIQTLNY
jgi:hypothetical protein